MSLVAYVAPASNGGLQLDSSAGLGNVRTISRRIFIPVLQLVEDHCFCLVISIGAQR
jgi:hypothetical protein